MVADLGSTSRQFEVSKALAIVTEPNSAAAEAIRALRTHIMAQHVQEGRRALAVCAASGEVGCSYVAANLAASMAQIGIKTLLLDANLRQPGVEEYFRPPSRSDGLAQYLASEDDNVGEYVHNEVIPNLSIMYSGGQPPNPQELLGRDRFAQLMNLCLRDFEFTIVDTPPANRCSDGRRASSTLGYSLVVARRDVSRIDDLKTLIDQLSGDRAKVIGTVLNEF